MSNLQIVPGKVYSLFGKNGIEEVKTSGLFLGQVVSYGDMANSRHEAVVIEEHGEMYGQACIFRDTFGKTTVSQTSIDGPGGWHKEDEITDGVEIAYLIKQSELAQQRQMNEHAQQRQTREDTLAKGKAIAERIRPSSAKAAIVARLEQDQSDSQSDYFGSKTVKTLFLGWSNHTKDLFAEMRKAASTRPETADYRPGKDRYTCRVVFTNDIVSNGSYYGAGNYSHWHDDIGNGKQFRTLAEAESFVAKAGTPESIGFEGSTANFTWRIEQSSIEHREKYSMGKGYYLADHSYSGWQVRKTTDDQEIWLALANTEPLTS